MKRFIHVLVIISLLSPVEYCLMSNANAAAAKAGGTCTKLNSKSTVKGYKFTCVKSGKRLVWSKGVKVLVKATPTPVIETNAITIILSKFANTYPIADSRAATKCDEGGDKFKDLYRYSGVQISDGAGIVLASGFLGSATVVTSFPNEPGSMPADCIFTAVLKVKKSDFYKIKIGDRFDQVFPYSYFVEKNWQLKVGIQ